MAFPVYLRTAAMLLLANLFLAGNARATAIAAHVATSISPGLWSYTIFNDEPLGSPNYLAAFTISVNAPVLVSASPTGWTSFTDNLTFVSWYNTDASLPYPNDVAPGASLSGFGLSSSVPDSALLPATLVAWDHVLDVPGPFSQDLTADAPSTPEPATVSLVAGLVLTFGVRKVAGLYLTRKR